MPVTGNETSKWQLVPEGEYKAKITHVGQKTNRKGYRKYEVTFTIIERPFKGRSVLCNCWLEGRQGRATAMHLFNSFGCQSPDLLETQIVKEVEWHIYVAVKRNEDNSSEYNIVEKFLPAEYIDFENDEESQDILFRIDREITERLYQ